MYDNLVFRKIKAPRREEEEKTAVAEATIPVQRESFIQKYGLDDVKITGPIGLALAIPALSNGVSGRFYAFSIHLNERLIIVYLE
jgi:hypothetical protein